MASSPPNHQAHHCSFTPGRQDLYLRLGSVAVFVRDQDRSLRFYLDQLGFALASDARLSSGHRSITVTPPDGTAILELIAPTPGSAESELIGRPTQVTFLTEDVVAKFKEWCKRGVRFHRVPEKHSAGAISAAFEDIDGNSFTLMRSDEVIREIERQRRVHVERAESVRRAAQENEFARQVQAKLFPQSQPALRSLEYAGVCMQARHVGGDYYDFLDLGRARLGLVIADISGKGTAAALLMANLQAHLRNQCTTYWSRPFTPFALGQPQRFLNSVNRLFCENIGDGAYATLFFAEYDDKERKLCYANCGHPSALLLRRDGHIERLESTCTVLGLFKEWDCPVAECGLFPGDTLLLYTDGMTESFNDAGEEFGEQRLIDEFLRSRDLPAQDLLAALAERARQFGRHEQHDDVTLVVARCKGD